ncbi:MAG: PHP domain-containing protein [Candidatus Aenigmarchaeota archaeon]|nr:PHP domain-containing protein [Candidatus Aenigmarchaeota archaeon]
MIPACLHIHTKYSITSKGIQDSRNKPQDILRRAKKLRLGILGITDHNTTRGAIETRKFATAPEDPLILIGQEIKTEYGDLIVYGSEEDLSGGLFDILDRVRSEGWFSVLPHPYDSIRKSSAIGMNLSSPEMAHLARKVDAVEVFNSRCLKTRFNYRAAKFAEQHNLPGVYGADAHYLGELSNAVNLIKCGKDEKEIYAAIREGKLTCHGRRTSPINYIRRPFDRFI